MSSIALKFVLSLSCGVFVAWLTLNFLGGCGDINGVCVGMPWGER